MDPGGQGGREGGPNRVHAFLAYLSFNRQLDDALDGLGGADPLGSFQGVPRGGRSVHPVSPRDASFGMGVSWGGRSANPMMEVVGIGEVLNGDNSPTGGHGNGRTPIVGSG